MKDNDKKTGFLKFYMSQKLVKTIISVVGIAVIVAVLGIGINKFLSIDNKTTKIGFEDIGELATQSAYCTEVNVTEASRDLFGITLPFTQSKYIYSYDVVIKAGYDFGEIDWNLNGNRIEVNLPEAKVLSVEINIDSFKLYHESESVFRQISLEENNQALQGLKENARTDALGNGLLENARSNAEVILTGFFGNVYDLEEYEIVFE